MCTKVYGSPRENKLGLPWMVTEGIFYTNKTIACFPQHMSVAGPNKHLPEAATPDHEDWGRKLQRSSWKKEKHNLLSTEHGLADFF